MECYTSLLRISSVYQIPLCGEGILSMTSGTLPLQIPLNKGKGKIIHSSFSRDVTTNYAMARALQVGHAGGHSAGRVVSKQRPLGQLLRALCFKYCINGLYLCCKELWTQYC